MERRSLLAAIFLLFAVLSVDAAPPRLTIAAVDKPSVPFLLAEGKQFDWQKPGITLEVLQRIEQRLGLEFDYRRLPWARCLKMVENDQAQAIFHSSFKPERAQYGAYPMRDGQLDTSRSLMTLSYVLYKRKDSNLDWDGQNLSGLNGPIATGIKYAIVDDLKKLGAPVREASSTLSQLRMLAKGRVAGVANLETITDPVLRLHQDEFGDIVKLTTPLTSRPYFLMFSKQFYAEHTELAEAIWNEIQQIRDSGEYDRIAEQYADLR